MISSNRLQKGLTSLGLDIEKENIEKLIAFSKLVIKWNKTHNLTSIKNSDDFVDKHILDSLTLLPRLLFAIENHKPSKEKPQSRLELLDIGSGAGFPGIVLAIASNNFLLTSVDANHKKIMFQNHIIREFDLTQIKTLHSRIEEIENQKFNIITCRAFASISHIIEKSHHLLGNEGMWLLMKGAYPNDEIAAFNRQEISQRFKVQSTESAEIPGLEAERHLVTIRAA